MALLVLDLRNEHGNSPVLRYPRGAQGTRFPRHGPDAARVEPTGEPASGSTPTAARWYPWERLPARPDLSPRDDRPRDAGGQRPEKCPRSPRSMGRWRGSPPSAPSRGSAGCGWSISTWNPSSPMCSNDRPTRSSSGRPPSAMAHETEAPSPDRGHPKALSPRGPLRPDRGLAARPSRSEKAGDGPPASISGMIMTPCNRAASSTEGRPLQIHTRKGICNGRPDLQSSRGVFCLSRIHQHSDIQYREADQCVSRLEQNSTC